jgi:hypothetical protein
VGGVVVEQQRSAFRGAVSDAFASGVGRALAQVRDEVGPRVVAAVPTRIPTQAATT